MGILLFIIVIIVALVVLAPMLAGGGKAGEAEMRARGVDVDHQFKRPPDEGGLL
jgi:hypothetical protein